MAATPDLPDVAEHLDDPRIEVFGMLLEAHNEVLNALARPAHSSVDLPVPWLGVLIRLARSPGQRLRMSELARDMTMSTSGLTRLIDRIEAAGLVQRQACPEDRRGLLAVLTEAGWGVLAEATPCHLADLERYVGQALDEEELAQLTDLLRKVRDHVRMLGSAPPPGLPDSAR
jgi:MarR family transcriptional regulator, 2-MHQ and catechol-resistance regulon repressor